MHHQQQQQPQQQQQMHHQQQQQQRKQQLSHHHCQHQYQHHLNEIPQGGKQQQQQQPLHHQKQDAHHHHHHHQKQDMHQQEHQPRQHRPHNHNHHHHQHHHHEDSGNAQRRTTVLIAMDGSPHSFYAFDWYMSHIHKPLNEVIVMHSSHSNHLLSCSEPLLPSVVDAPSTVMSRLASKEEEEVNRIAQMIKGKLTATGVRGRVVRLSGDPGPAIVELASENKVDCIVTGSRGMGTIKRALIGSVSDYVIHHAACPVLVCRYKDNGVGNHSSSNKSQSDGNS